MTIHFGDSTSISSGGALGKVANMSTSQFCATISSASYTSLTGHSVSLTPSSSSSKFLIIIESAGTQNNGASNSGFRITRYKHTSASTTELHTGNAYANPGGIRSLVPMFSNYLDQPSTTEQLTYAVDFKTQNSGGLGTASYGACGSITVLEIT
tara:strand:- start:203 stop:664 length:462 start_codon:yes stop_codon:yes gene_type:complete